MAEEDILAGAERLAARLPPLLAEAERVARTFMKGVHGRRRVGMGESFWQFRPFETGDSARSIDWRQSARRDQVYIRQTEWEAAQTVWLCRDPAPSMDYKSDVRFRSKGACADILLLALAMLLLDGGEQAGVMGADHPPHRGAAAALALHEQLLQRPLMMAARNQKMAKYSSAAVFSDFWRDPVDIEADVHAMAAQDVRGVLIQVLDPAERDFPFSGRLRLIGMEGGGAETLLVPKAEEARAVYAAKFEAHVVSLKKIASSCGWTFLQIFTDQSLEKGIAALYEVITVKPQGIT